MRSPRKVGKFWKAEGGISQEWGETRKFYAMSIFDNEGEYILYISDDRNETQD